MRQVSANFTTKKTLLAVVSRCLSLDNVQATVSCSHDLYVKSRVMKPRGNGVVNVVLGVVVEDIIFDGGN